MRMGCTGDDSFLGAGGHAWDVDHGGETFPLWVSEPGIGKSETDTVPDDWYYTGTRHASSYPVPFLLRPAEPLGLGIGTWSRVELDLCASNEQTWSVTAWEGGMDLAWIVGDEPIEVVERHARFAGLVDALPDWAFAPWNDAVRGEEEVRDVARTLRAAGAPSSVIWTEDWKGGEEDFTGYHLLLEWFLDTDLYPDAEGLDAELERLGFKWLGYFSPFIGADTETFVEAEEHVIVDEDGEPYWFPGVNLGDTTVLDVSDDDARAWALEKMDEAIALGFDGWMADFGEWLPPDAELSRLDPISEHNGYPTLWQSISQEALEGTDGLFFARSGWEGSQGQVPVTWAGDQWTTFDVDDGLPTVVPMGLGLATSGVPYFAHDIAGYNSLGVDTSTRELWYRWCALGAFTPIMRTHHGMYDDDNWQFDTDPETLDHYVSYARVHTRLLPYLQGLAALYEDRGRPLLLHPALVYEGVPWDAVDSWLLGEGMWVAPVLEAGVEGREVALPEGVRWFDWWTSAEVGAGWMDADVSEIPVFVSEGSVIPTLTWAPDTLTRRSAAMAGPSHDPWGPLTTLTEADRERTVHVYGSGGRFEEKDGTLYSVSGEASATGTASETLTSGTVEVAGLELTIDGTVERTYTVVVVP
jgi:alpha-glucosidase (family GH31 glycosyl hydrolase)